MFSSTIVNVIFSSFSFRLFERERKKALSTAWLILCVLEFCSCVTICLFVCLLVAIVDLQCGIEKVSTKCLCDLVAFNHIKSYFQYESLHGKYTELLRCAHFKWQSATTQFIYCTYTYRSLRTVWKMNWIFLIVKHCVCVLVREIDML